MSVVRCLGTGFLFAIASLGPFSAGSAIAQQLPNSATPTSVDRVKETLARTPAQSLKFDARMPQPVATFRVTVNQRAFVEPILVTLRKEFELTPLQRQSWDWYSKCCGINLMLVPEFLQKEFRQWQERRIHERVTRELAEVIAASEK